MGTCLFWFQVPCSWIVALNCFHTEGHKHTQIHLLIIHIEADILLGSLYTEFLDLTYPFYQFSLYSFFRWKDIPQSLDFFPPHKVWRKQEVRSKDQREETPVLVWLGPVLLYLFYNTSRAKEALQSHTHEQLKLTTSFENSWKFSHINLHHQEGHIETLM